MLIKHISYPVKFANKIHAVPSTVVANSVFLPVEYLCICDYCTCLYICFELTRGNFRTSNEE